MVKFTKAVYGREREFEVNEMESAGRKFVCGMGWLMEIWVVGHLNEMYVRETYMRNRRI